MIKAVFYLVREISAYLSFFASKTSAAGIQNIRRDLFSLTEER